MALAPGTRLGAYEILSVIGSGGMGEVYRARDQKLDRDVVIKVLRTKLAAYLTIGAETLSERKVRAGGSPPCSAAIGR